MQTITVKGPSETYSVLVGERLLGELGAHVRAAGLAGRVALVTDDRVGPLHAAAARAGLEQAGLRAISITLPAGEAHKNLDSVRWLYEQFLDAGLDRSAAVVALGGGVVGDMAGFAAATYMRGLPLVQVPTTLLAMVDSSIGGKVGVDLRRGKNLVGAFKQPALVVADTTSLRTLPPADFASGLAEVAKHGIIGDPALFEHLEAHGPEPIDRVLAAAIDVKRRVVEADPFERGVRATLNLGHTFGHALETLSDYQMRHGYAVSVGMVLAARLSARLGLCPPELAERIAALLTRLGLPVTVAGTAPERVWAAMAYDKKREGKGLRFVLPRAIGDVIVRGDVPDRAVLEVLAEDKK